MSTKKTKSEPVGTKSTPDKELHVKEFVEEMTGVTILPEDIEKTRVELSETTAKWYDEHPDLQEKRRASKKRKAESKARKEQRKKEKEERIKALGDDYVSDWDKYDLKNSPKRIRERKIKKIMGSQYPEEGVIIKLDPDAEEQIAKYKEEKKAKRAAMKNEKKSWIASIEEAKKKYIEEEEQMEKGVLDNTDVEEIKEPETVTEAIPGTETLQEESVMEVEEKETTDTEDDTVTEEPVQEPVCEDVVEEVAEVVEEETNETTDNEKDELDKIAESLSEAVKEEKKQEEEKQEQKGQVLLKERPFVHQRRGYYHMGQRIDY